MPFARILVHAVWATKDRRPLMSIEDKDTICTHIRKYALTKDIHLLNVNGFTDHLHCLISISPEQNISNVMNLIKGESSFWTNQNLKLKEKFGWQNEYFAVSVSESHFGAVNAYITNQEIHHRKKTFQEEYDEFMNKYPFFEKEKGLKP